VWVDLEPCKELVANICTLFNTRPYVAGSGGSVGGAGKGGDGIAGKSADGAAMSKSVEGLEVTVAAGDGGGEGSGGSKEMCLTGVETVPR